MPPLFALLFRVTCVLTIALLQANAVDLQLQFRHTHNGNPLLLNSLRYQNSAGETFAVSRLSYLISELSLQDTEGKWTAVPNAYGFIDAFTGRKALILEDLPEGNYTALSFSIGLNESINHSAPAQYPASHPLNPNRNNLHWDWQTGYIFLAIEGTFRTPDSSLSGYVYHFANDPQKTTISISFPHDIQSDSLLEIDLDIAALLNSPIPLSFVNDGASSHSREGDPIVKALKANLANAFQLKRITSQQPLAIQEKLKPIDLPNTLTPYPFQMSARFPMPALPLDNPPIKERVKLGEKLFHDPILSGDNTVACSSCHKQSTAHSDNLVQSIGIRGQLSRRHSMPLFNLAWKSHFFWDGRASSLREQSLIPIEDPLEMDNSIPNVLDKLEASDDYPALFAQAFGSAEMTVENLSLALESFLLSLTSYNSKFDQAIAGKATLSEEEQRGLMLFMTEFEPRSKQFGADCFHCHGGALFTDNRFHDNGLTIQRGDIGRAEATGNPSDRSKFSTPSLRNIAITAPYMHDGRFQTLEQVIDHYSSGIELRPTLDPNLAKHPQGGLQLSTEDKQALIAFLKTLTDPQYLQNTQK